MLLWSLKRDKTKANKRNVKKADFSDSDSPGSYSDKNSSGDDEDNELCEESRRIAKTLNNLQL